MLIQADARAIPLYDNYVQTVITSPPYWGLRDYGIGGQLGLEVSPAVYVQNLVAVFAEVWRVLRDDGSLWLNLGDSHAAHPGQRKITDKAGAKQQTKRGSTGSPSRYVEELKAKDLVGIPWRVAFALQAAGWYLRSDIIWSKPNPMPESVTDRPTRSHEYLFLLTKQEKYYYDHEAVKEPAVSTEARKFTDGGKDKQRGHSRKHAGFNGRYAETVLREGAPLTRNRRSVWTIATKPYAEAHFATFPPALVEPCLLAGSADWEVDPARCVVLDPFCGSGTVGQVARQHGRFFIGCDLSFPYLQLAQRRLA